MTSLGRRLLYSSNAHSRKTIQASSTESYRYHDRNALAGSSGPLVPGAVVPGLLLLLLPPTTDKRASDSEDRRTRQADAHNHLQVQKTHCPAAGPRNLNRPSFQPRAGANPESAVNATRLLLRATTPLDVPLILGFEEDADTSPWIGQGGREWHASALRDADQEHLMGVVGDEPIGFVVLVGLKDHQRGIELRRIVVRSDTRNGGLGRGIFRSAVDRCFLEHQAHRVWLDVKVENERAHHLYRGEGFVDEGTLREAYLEAGGRRTSLRIMSILKREWETRAPRGSRPPA